MLYYLPHIKLKMDINDVPNSGQPMSSGKKLLAKQKAKVLPDELLVIMDCAENHAKFVIARSFCSLREIDNCLHRTIARIGSGNTHEKLDVRVQPTSNVLEGTVQLNFQRDYTTTK
jgi:hypothetical protein